MKNKCGQHKDNKNERQSESGYGVVPRYSNATAIALGACYPLQITIIQVLIEGLR
jgi:hypothetical protein